MEDTIDQLTVANTDYKIVRGLAKLLKDECEFETVAPLKPRENRQALLEKANDSYPIVRQPTLCDDTQKLEVYGSVVDELGITLEEYHQGMYANLEEHKRLIRFGDRVSDEYDGEDDSATTTRLTGDSEESYAEDTITVDWLLTRYNLALAQPVLYDATETRIRV